MNAQGMLYSGIVFSAWRTDVGARKEAAQTCASSTQEVGTLRVSATILQWERTSVSNAKPSPET